MIDPKIQIDLKTLFSLLDKVITSEDPEIQQAFQELLVIVALKQPGEVVGPLRTLLTDIDKIKDRLSRVEYEYVHEPFSKSRKYSTPYDYKDMWDQTYAKKDLDRITDILEQMRPSTYKYKKDASDI